MRKIPLSREMFALVDDDDYEALSAVRWHAHWTGSRWYARRERRTANGRRECIYMHRTIISGDEIDHKDGDGLNNQRGNLRVATRSMNMGNTKIRSDSEQPYKGIYQLPSGRWAARIRGRYLGTHKTSEVAALAYDMAALATFGQFARLNFPESS